jgi:hypothetical protein
MELKDYVGIWRNEIGNEIIIQPKDKKSLKVSFISYVDNKPINRQYSGGSYSIEMHAELDYYKTSLDVELWEKGKGFQLNLMPEIMNENELVPGISRYTNDKFLDKYYYLFGPLTRYTRTGKTS